jgi:hypothetical protein
MCQARCHAGQVVRSQDPRGVDVGVLLVLGGFLHRGGCAWSREQDNGNSDEERTQLEEADVALSGLDRVVQPRRCEDEKSGQCVDRNGWAECARFVQGDRPVPGGVLAFGDEIQLQRRNETCTAKILQKPESDRTGRAETLNVQICGWRELLTVEARRRERPFCGSPPRPMR